MTSDAWSFTIERDLYLKGPGHKPVRPIVEPDDPDMPEPIITPGDTVVVYKDRYVLKVDTIYVGDSVMTVYDTVYIRETDTIVERDIVEVPIIGPIKIDTLGCPIIYHAGTLYGISEGDETEPGRIEPIPNSYFRYFGYNQTDISLNENRFKLLINDLVKQLEQNNTLTVYIVASASQVPTYAYCSNFELARKRAEAPEQRIISYLKQKGISQERVYFDKRYIVEGPEYQDDAKNKDKYEKYQYVKVWLYSCDKNINR